MTSVWHSRLLMVTAKNDPPFDEKGETRAIALDTCKAFYRLWQNILHKMKDGDISE